MTAAVPRIRLGRVVYLGFITLVYVFLLMPLVIVVLASFNSGEFLTFPPEGFSLRWYVSFFDSESFMGSLFYSLKVAIVCTFFSTILGTTVALYVVRFSGRSYYPSIDDPEIEIYQHGQANEPPAVADIA